MIPISKALALAIIAIAAALAGCADLTVNKVTDTNDATVKGVRYYLPKPIIVFVPQADGTVMHNVVYLPDKNHEYAVDANSTLSSNAVQATTDPVGLLTAVQFNADTTAVASQAIASGGAAIAQGLNYEAARSMAIQTQVNAAQTNVITAQSAYAAALAALNSDTQANISSPGSVTASAIQADASTVAQKLAGLQVAQATLQAAQTTPQVVALSAAAGTPISSTAAAPGTAWGAPTWSTGLAVNLPEQYGPLWFAVNDDGQNVSLKAITSKVPGTTAKDGKPDPQPAFKTTLSALGPPQVPTPTSPYTLASKLSAVFSFNRDVFDVDPSVTYADGTSLKQAVAEWDSKRAVIVDISKLKPGTYWLNVTYKYAVDPGDPTAKPTAFQKVLFNVVDK